LTDIICGVLAAYGYFPFQCRHLPHLLFAKYLKIIKWAQNLAKTWKNI